MKIVYFIVKRESKSSERESLRLKIRYAYAPYVCRLQLLQLLLLTLLSPATYALY